MQDLDWNDLALLLALHRGGTLSAAAGPLGCNASTVSRRLKAFETRLGQDLFIRTPEGLLPTELAGRLLPHAEGAEAAVLAAASAADGSTVEPRGSVRLAVPSGLAAYHLAPALPGFQERHPRLQLEIVVGVGLTDLTRMEADIALRLVRPTKGDLVAKRLPGFGPYAAVASQAYEAGRTGPLRWIGWSQDFGHLPVARMLTDAIGRPPDLRCNDMVVMVECLRAGAGAMLLPRRLVDSVPDLVEVRDPPALPPDETPLWLACHRARREVPRVQAVWRWLEEIVRAR